MPNNRGVQNGARQSFVYRGIQVMPSLDGGWLATIGARLYTEASEDDICFAIDAAHLIIENCSKSAQQCKQHPAHNQNQLSAAGAGAPPPRTVPAAIAPHEEVQHETHTVHAGAEIRAAGRPANDSSHGQHSA